MTTEPHGVAIIGLGTVGRRFVEQFGAHEGFELIGGFDLSDASSAAANADFGISIAANADALIADDRVDVVYIAVPPLHHEAYVDQVCAANKTVFCEKPLGVDDDASAAMVERVEQWPGQAAVNFVFGGAPGATEMVARVKRGECGELHGADLRLHFETWPRAWQADATWLRDRDQGGWTREVISHYVFLIHRLFGPSEVRHAHVDYPADGTSEQSLLATLDAAGVPIRIVATSDAAGPDEVEFTVRGSEGALRLTNWYELTSAKPGSEWAPVFDAATAAGPAAYRAQLEQVKNLASGQKHTLASFREALDVQVVVESLLGR